MADLKKAGMISGMSPLPVITGDELLEVSARQRDGTWKTYSILINKIRTNQGLSAYEVALKNGFVGTEDQWLASLNGKTAYRTAVDLGFVGTEEEWLATLVGPSAYQGAKKLDPSIGTEAQWLESLKGKSAYQIAVLNGFVGTEQKWLASLVGKSAYEIAKEIDPSIGTEAQWLKTLVGLSAYEVARKNGYVGTEAAWLKSLEGKSAYQIWIAAGNAGTEADFIKSLKGESAFDTYKAQPGNANKTEAQFIASLKGTNGTNGIDGENGIDGDSAYQIWLKVPANAGKSEAQFLASLKGDKGTDGTNGTNGKDGKSAYDSYKALPGNAAKTEAEFIASLEGKSAYEVWSAAGNVGDEAKFLESLIGESGEDGKSAYETYKGLPGNASKTEAEFIASLKGAAGRDGTNGTNGTDGEDGKAINVVGNVDQETFNQIVADGTSEIADAYFVGDVLNVFNGVDWIESNSLEGPAGRGLNYLGEWPSASALPLEETFVPGDTYIWGAVGQNKSLWTLSDKPTRRWVDIGVPGPMGASAYETWKQQGGVGNEAAFLADIKGQKGDTGDTGPQGKSPYQLAVEGGFVGNEAAWLASLHGEDGDSAYQIWESKPENTGKSEAQYLASLKGAKGEPAAAFEIAGQLANVSELPRPGQANKAYYVAKDLYVWLADINDYKNLGSMDGASAYQIWLAAGNTGTEADFLKSIQGKSAYETYKGLPGNSAKTEAEFIASLKGKDGTNGTNGTDGAKGADGTNGKSAYEIWVADPANIGKPESEFIANLNGQSAYALWEEQAGNDGKTEADFLKSLEGKSAYETYKALPGNAAKTEAEFIASLKGADGLDGQDGEKGADGKNLTVKGTLANEAAIKALVNPAVQDAYIANDTGNLWIYNGTAWVDAGPFRGTNGKSAYQIWEAVPANNGKSEAQFLASLKGADGAAGTDGTNGTNGTDGKDGKNVVIKGSVANMAALNALPAPAEQDAYTVLDTGHLYMRIGAAWVDLGAFKGDQGERGEDGPPGQGINIVSTVATIAERPAVATLKVGDAVYVEEDGNLYQVNDAGVYGPGIAIKGLKGDTGEQGEQGEKGDIGTSITIMGSYATEAALKLAHPTGVAGEGYLIGNDLYLYGVNPVGGTTEWYNAGPVRGPKGDQGIQGKQGTQGKIGPAGDRGSLWINLPPGVEEPGLQHGRDGDWAVSKLFETFYRDKATGWAPMGRLVAGDVNSPVASLGKVVREGTEWVKLPVDAVPTPAVGKQYVMKGIADGKTEWTEVVIPTDDVTNPVVDKQYVKKGIAGGKTIWSEITIPEAGIAEVPASTTIPQGRTSAGWVAVAPALSGTAGKNYVMTTTGWKLSGIQADAPSTTSKPLCYQVDGAGVGSWVPVSMDSYSLLINGATANQVSFTPDFSKQQCYRVSAQSATPVVITLNDFTANRSMLAVFTIEGATAKVQFASGSGAPTIAYNNNVVAADIEYGAAQTIITAFYNGYKGWIISKGPSY